MPDLILDIFNNDAFSAATLTDTVNMVPNLYGRVNQLGLFQPEPIATTAAVVVIENGVLNVLPMRPRGAAPSYGTRDGRKVKAFVVPHIPHDDAVLTSDVQNMLAWAPGGALTPATLENVQGFMNRKLITARRKHALTLENIRVGALMGVIRDYDGSIVLDLFAEFGVTQQSFDFVLGTTTTDVGSICDDLTGYMEDNLLGETMTSIHCLASPLFMKRLLSQNSVKEAYKFFNSANGGNPNRDNMRKMFPFHGIMFEEYRGFAPVLNEDGTRTYSARFIPDGEARFFPMGTTETFVNYWAPPDFMGEENEAPDITTSEVFVAPLERMKFGKGLELHTESNPLPMVKRPALLVRGFSSN